MPFIYYSLLWIFLHRVSDALLTLYSRAPLLNKSNRNLAAIIRLLSSFLLPVFKHAVFLPRLTPELKAVFSKSRVKAEQFHSFCAFSASFAILSVYIWTGSKTISSIAGIIIASTPYILLRNKYKEKRQIFLTSLPDYLDLLKLCTGCGMDLYSSIVEIHKSNAKSPVSISFNSIVNEIKEGIPAEKVLQRHSEETAFPEISSILNSFRRQQKTGISLSKILTAKSEGLRNSRFRAAEKAAAEAPVKMLLPLALFIFPSAFIILLGPVVQRILSGGGL